MKNRIYIAVIAAIIGAIIHRTLKTKPEPVLLEIPPLSPELQKWASYVERYPNLEDDPKIARAIEVLRNDEENFN